MSRGFNWGRVAKEAQQRRYGTQSVAVGLPTPESKKRKGRGKLKRPAPPAADEPSYKQKLAHALVAYMHEVAWNDVRKMPPPAVPPLLWKALGQGADALKKMRKDRRYPAIRRKVERRHLSQVQPEPPPQPPASRKFKIEQRRDKRIENYRTELGRLQNGRDAEDGRALTTVEREARIAELQNLLTRLSTRT